jgi:hypothetical protein
MDIVERVLISRDRTWKAEIFRRPDGTCGFTPFRWSEQEGCWVEQGFRAASVTDSVEAAEKEARERVPQLGNARVADA